MDFAKVNKERITQRILKQQFLTPEPGVKVESAQDKALT